MLVGLLFALSGCASQTPAVQAPGQLTSTPSASSPDNAEKLFVVDCLLPARIRKLGRKLTYLAPRQPIKTSAQDCETRGGEYDVPPLTVWLPRAKDGDQEAQTYVGEIFEKGRGAPRDYALAAEWYRKAAEQGNTRAQINLGHLYEKGLGVEKDPVQALNWYRKASGLSEAISLDAGSIRYSGLETETQQELQELRQEVERWKHESESLRQQLDQTQQQLDQTRQELQRRQSEVDAERQTLEQALQDLERRKQQAESATGETAEFKRLEAQLRQRQAELARQQQDVARLQQTEWQKLEQARQELERRKQQVEAAAQDAAEFKRLEAQLRQRETELTRQQQDVIQLQQTERQKLEQARQDLDRRKQQVEATAQDAAEFKRLEAQLRQRQAELARRQQDVTRLRQEKAQLEDEATRHRTQLAKLEKQRQQVALAGPVIEMIDPPLTGATRGISVVKISSDMVGHEREIVGRVTSPAGLLTLTVNDRQHNLRNNGLFRVSIPVQGSSVPVKLVAIDQQGKRASVEFQLTADAAASSVAPKPQAAPARDFGNYYAFVIGNKTYAHWPSLKTPENDAREMADILGKKYGFKTKLLFNATRFDILQALNELRKKLTEKDNLLIYYAGHGHWEEKIQRGYWVPVDGDLDSNVNWISTIAITDVLGAMSAKHVLVVADSCYSGALTRSALARLEAGMSDQAREHWLKVMAEKRSRTVLSSGDLQPVLDTGGGRHSVFAKAFLDVLSDNAEILAGQYLHSQVAARVAYAASAELAEQTPQYAPLRYAGHEAGDFIFVPTTAQ
jgi:TPR repeat protein